MKREALNEAVGMALRVLDKTATEGDKIALQMFLALITRREERAYNDALKAALAPITRGIHREQLDAAKKAEEKRQRDFFAGRTYSDGCPREAGR